MNSTIYYIEDRFPYIIKRSHTNQVHWYEHYYETNFLAQHKQCQLLIEYFTRKLETQNKKKHPKLRNKIQKHEKKIKEMKQNFPEEFI